MKSIIIIMEMIWSCDKNALPILNRIGYCQEMNTVICVCAPASLNSIVHFFSKKKKLNQTSLLNSIESWAKQLTLILCRKKKYCALLHFENANRPKVNMFATTATTDCFCINAPGQKRGKFHFERNIYLKMPVAMDWHELMRFFVSLQQQQQQQ